MGGIRHLVAGNWKMNGDLAMAASLADSVVEGAGTAQRADLLICPASPHLIRVGERLKGSSVALGGQDCHTEGNGAHTGDVSAPMLKDIGCSYVILGHSERRTEHGESSAIVAAKAATAQAAGLTAIVCVGESEATRNENQTLSVIENQIINSIPAGSTSTSLVVAYEPVWAIGTGRTPTSAEVAAVHRHIRRLLVTKLSDGAFIRILYGGSVKPSNAAELMAVPDVNGALVGGASLKAADFLAIAAAC